MDVWFVRVLSGLSVPSGDSTALLRTGRLTRSYLLQRVMFPLAYAISLYVVQPTFGLYIIVSLLVSDTSLWCVCLCFCCTGTWPALGWVPIPPSMPVKRVYWFLRGEDGNGRNVAAVTDGWVCQYRHTLRVSLSSALRRHGFWLVFILLFFFTCHISSFLVSASLGAYANVVNITKISVLIDISSLCELLLRVLWHNSTLVCLCFTLADVRSVDIPSAAALPLWCPCRRSNL